jgi:FlaA1/EpsC-like NDP-sugar epimerase
MKNKAINMLKEQLRLLWTLIIRKNFWIVLLIDIVLIVAAHFLANLVRYDWYISWRLTAIFAVLPFLLVTKIPVFYIFGLYRGMWRYTSIADLINITKAVCVSSGFIIMSVLYLNRFEGFSRSVFFMDGVFTFLFLCLHRGTIRYLFQNKTLMPWLSQDDDKPDKIRLLLIGAGTAAEKVIREIKDNNNISYEVVGLVDDDQNKHGLKIHGIPVVGGLDKLQECITRTKPEELLIAVASASAEQMQRIIDLCQKSKIKHKVLPSMGEIIKGKISVTSSRDISYKDLLGRPAVHLDQKEIGRYLSGQTILVTGAGGSIGSELCRQILRFSPERLILFDSSEENLYAIQMELVHELGTLDAVPVLGKVQDVRLLDLIFRTHRPSVVFHAAAYKHVPLVERNPWQAVNNNIFATQLLIEGAIIHQVERFVLVSTDKAVRPTNVMGASKRLTELLVQAYDRNNWDKKFTQAWQRVYPQIEQSPMFNDQFPMHSTRFMAVRFGNVIGSSGSVVPLFKKQIERGGPITVTHPEVTRYFMSIEEAAQLILQAGSMGGEGTEVFILKMGQPVKIVHMAREMIRLAGKEPDVEIEIKYTGLREGEKLYEELITEGEGIVDTHHKKIMVLRGDSFIPCTRIHGYLEQLAEGARAYNGRAIKKTLNQIIPEYHPDDDCRSVGNKETFFRDLNN